MEEEQGRKEDTSRSRADIILDRCIKHCILYFVDFDTIISTKYSGALGRRNEHASVKKFFTTIEHLNSFYRSTTPVKYSLR